MTWVKLFPVFLIALVSCHTSDLKYEEVRYVDTLTAGELKIILPEPPFVLSYAIGISEEFQKNIDGYSFHYSDEQVRIGVKADESHDSKFDQEDISDFLESINELDTSAIITDTVFDIEKKFVIAYGENPLPSDSSKYFIRYMAYPFNSKVVFRLDLSKNVFNRSKNSITSYLKAVKYEHK